MQTRRPRPWTAFALLCLALWMPRPADAAPEPAAVTPTQARQVLDLLRDDARRAELEQTLSG